MPLGQRADAKGGTGQGGGRPIVRGARPRPPRTLRAAGSRWREGCPLAVSPFVSLPVAHARECVSV